MTESAHAKPKRNLHKEAKPEKRRKLPKENVWARYMRDLSSGKLRITDHKAEAEKLVKAAEGAEKKGNCARASVLHEKAGDSFCLCRTEDFGPLIADRSVPNFHSALPERVEPVMGRTMYEEAIREYRLAADLVRKTDPDRAGRLESKIYIAQSKLRDEEDGVRPD